MEFSYHSMARRQQRAISQKVIDLILTFGQPEKKYGKAREYRIRKKDIQEIIGNMKFAIHSLEKARNRAVLVDGAEQTVITVYVTH